MITVGETSEEFQFYTLLSSPPSSLVCETTDDTLSISWSDPTVGLVAGTDYTYSFSLMESMFSQYKYTYKAFPNFLKYLAATDNVVYEGTSDITYNDGSIWTRKVSINESIASATTYEFSVKIIVDNIQTLTSDGTYEFTEMESEEGSVKCYTNPAQLLGIHDLS